MIITEVLAVLSISAATGIRLALPLLLMGLMSGDELWSNVPLLSAIHPTLLIGVLVTWSTAELVLSKDHFSRRLFQTTELMLSPAVGAIAGIGIARTVGLSGWIFIVIGIVSALLATVMQLIQVGWNYRPRRPPLWLFFVLDGLCVFLAILAFDSPEQGGLIAMMLLWVVVHTSAVWRQWRHRPIATDD
ncbi:DUF4126 domain-containing protein [filamentous cyanobacterium CCP5]|nr:DUF4126 domain-containing protein [filamentous cyanobacterium CCT1]PSN18894.1 DUF4126 domain-containing protein [filamentous cyanobacterium CCP5]